MGYYRAGFEVVGVDIAHQPHYPFEFHQADALEYCAAHGREFDVIHASPPCQGYSILNSDGHLDGYAKLIPQVRAALISAGMPWVIENVPGAPLNIHLLLCGSMFGLRVKRHRYFESNIPMPLSPASCNHSVRFLDMYSSGPERNGTEREYADEMGVTWIPTSRSGEAIPPAYTEFIGRHFLQAAPGSAAERITE
jgi:DNA (cytosine-5)-methyltransferase 1